MSRATEVLGYVAVAVVSVTAGVAISQALEEPAESVVETVTVTETPGACFDALAAAEDIFALSGHVVGTVMPQSLQAAFDRDVVGLEQAVADMDAANAEIEGSPYRALADECLAAGGAS